MIRSGIKKLTGSLLERISRNFSDVSYFAIHPGGKKILEVIEQELGISKDSNRHAYEVLKRFGNMSSPTVLFVLNEISKTLSDKDQNKNILSFAFGPGLTLESMLLQIEIIEMTISFSQRSEGIEIMETLSFMMKLFFKHFVNWILSING